MQDLENTTQYRLEHPEMLESIEQEHSKMSLDDFQSSVRQVLDMSHQAAPYVMSFDE